MSKKSDLPCSQRPENRVAGELGTLREDELLAFSLGSGIVGANAKTVAQQLLKKFGKNLYHASSQELQKIKGIGPVKAARLAAAFELSRRLAGGLSEHKLETASDAAKVCADLAGGNQEILGFLALDSRGCLISRNDLYRGTRSLTVADPKHLFGEALKCKAHSILIYHNHPGGSSEPSKQDVETATRMANAGILLNLHVVDFVVLAKTGFCSLLGSKVAVDNPCYIREGLEQLTFTSFLIEKPANWPPRIDLAIQKSDRQTLWSVDLFAGCGGLSLGLEQAGFQTLLVSELNHNAMETYMANRIQNAHVPTSFHDVYSITDDVLDDLVSGWKGIGINDIDLIAGGPPCQGYSGIGHRRSYKVEKEKIPSNHLFKEMTRIISRLRPKMFLFENVKGLLSARWTADGSKGEIWNAVQKAFREINGGEYYVDFQLVQAKDYGVPQNRPRILMVGMRRDLNWQHLKDDKIASGLLPDKNGTPPSIEDMLSDLVDPDYLDKKSTNKYLCDPQNDIQRKLRTSADGKHVALKGEPLAEQEYSNHAPKIREKFQHMLENNGEIPECMRTKKFAQRVLPRTWDERGPSITVTSLPEDYVHYCQPRSLTVREWARLQMFPDWYQFKGSRTTGGIRRAGNPHAGIWDRECPRYTQIGNAVPVELARKVGIHLAAIIRKATR